MVEFFENRPFLAAGLVVAVAFGLGFAGWSLLVDGTGKEASKQASLESEWAESPPDSPEATTDPPAPAEEPAEETPSSEERAERREQGDEGETNERSDEPTKLVDKKSDGEGEKRDGDKNDIDRPVDATPKELFPGQANKQQQRKEYKPAVLEIVTNFDKADATVNGLPYPEYVAGDGEEPGMVLPAGGPYTVKVTYAGKTKTYTISLRPYQVRVMMVELSGYDGGAPAPEPTRNIGGGQSDHGNTSRQGSGRVTVYSKPKGRIQVDGNPRKQKTPGTIEVEAGQHDIQVEFDDGSRSQSKTVRVRKGSRIKLFFRKRD